jgi:hypothetical protein
VDLSGAVKTAPHLHTSRRGVGFARVSDAGDFLAALQGEAVPAGNVVFTGKSKR